MKYNASGNVVLAMGDRKILEISMYLKNVESSKLTILRISGHFLYPGVNANPLTGWKKVQVGTSDCPIPFGSAPLDYSKVE